MLTYSNIGESYTLLRHYDKSLEYAEKALLLAEKINQKKSILQAYRTLAHVHIVLKNFEKADEIIKKALFMAQIDKETERELLFRLLEVDFWKQKGDFEKAFQAAENALDLAQKLKNAESLREAYEKHSLIAEKLNQDSVALLSFKKFISVRDSLANENNYKAALTKEFSYKAEKQQFEQEKKTLAMQAEMSVLERDKKILQKQAEAERLAELARSEHNKRKADSLTNLANQNKLEAKNLQILREKQDLEMKTERDAQKRITNTFLGIFCTIFIILLLMAWGFRQKQKANRLLMLKNNEILSQKEEIAQHLILLEKQKHHIEKQHEDITNSINVGKRIQIASLPFDALLKGLAADFFILWRPRNIVSGDFYWFHEVSRSFTADTFHRIYIVGDCTGHGVPGAFMSMIGVNLLNDIVKVRKIISPDEILNLLRSGIYSALQQALTGSKEGMDIAVLSIEKTRRSKKILFAGAMNPLYYVQNSHFYELKGDKMPIGGKFDEKTYGLHEIYLSNEENMVLWLTTDGFQDQFGGENDKKFMVKKFKELLFSISEKSLDRQKEILEKTFDLWKGEQEQTDDVTVLGIRV